MTNLSGYLKRTLFLFSFLLTTFLTFPNNLHANEELSKSSNSTYTVNLQGDLEADYTFTLSRKSEIPAVITNFSLSIPFEDYSSVDITVGGNNYKYTTKKESGGTQINFELPNIIVTRSSPLFISAKVSIDKYVNIEGENYYVLIPPVPSFVTDSVYIKYPSKWGDIAWSSAQWEIEQRNASEITLKMIEVDEPLNPSIAILIGNEIGYKIAMEKPLQNQTEEDVVYKISLPKEGDGQHVLYSKVTPKPFSIDYDQYGNLNISYILKPGETAQVSIDGFIFFDSEEHSIPETFDPYLTQNGYWEFSDDTEQKRLTVFLRTNGLNNDYTSLTSQEQKEMSELLNQYVIDRLNPVSSTDSNIKAEIRNGASNISTMLTGGAYPDDYTDMLIAVMREFKIPSRMVLGYISPLNSYQKEGFFHSWVEYWDPTTNRWTLLDPALEDYFPTRYINTIYDHVRIVVRGENSITPNISKFSAEEFTLIPAPNSVSAYNEFEIEFDTLSLNKGITKGELIINNIGNKIVKLVDIKLQYKGELVKPLDFWSAKSIVPGENLITNVSFNAKPTSDDKVVLTFQDFEGNIIRKTIPVSYSLTTASPSNLINLAISFIIYAILYIIVIKLKKKKNG